MTTVTASQFDVFNDLAFYQAVAGSHVFTKTYPTYQSADEIVFSYTDGANGYVLDLFGNFTYSGKTLTGGTLTGITQNKDPANDISHQFQAFDIEGFSIPVPTFEGYLFTADPKTAIFNALFGGDDHFTVLAPGPDVIDGGPGNDTVTFVSNLADNTIVLNADGSETVTGPAGQTILRNVEHLQFNDANFAPDQLAIVDKDYAQLEGRAPSADEVSFWTQSLASGTTDAQLQQALAQDPNNARPIALIDSLYEADTGRIATSDEFNFWLSALQSGYTTVDQLAKALLDPSISPQSAQTGANTVQGAYELMIGRAASDPEVNYWVGQLQGAHATIGDMERVLASTPDYFGGSSLSVGITAAYDNLIGRDPTSDEANFWQNSFSQGGIVGTLRFLRSILTNSSDGQQHLAADVQGVYETVVGRDPSAGETSYWNDQIQNHGLSVFQVLEDVSAAAPGAVAANVTTLYDEFLGREPTAAELADAVGRLSTGIVEAPQLQQGLAAQADSNTVFNDVIGLYQLYTGQAPDSAHLNSDIAAVDHGLPLYHLAQELLASPDGQAHIGDEIAFLYSTYGGYTADDSTKSYWAGQLNSGQTSYAKISDILASLTNNGHTYHIDLVTDSTDNSASFNGATFGHAVLSSFTPGTSHIDFSGTAFSGFAPLAHAEQVDFSNAPSDVLITYDSQDTILIQGVTLAQLHAADFVFS